VFLNETYKGRTFGAATVFFKDIRISTNVATLNGKRAIGTKASNDVREHVFQKGDTWTERALVISNWYITAYEPIEDIFGNRVGMLGLGVLEQKYVDLRREALSVFAFITVVSMLLAVGLGWLLAAKIMFPVRRLIKASQQVSEGSLSPDIGPISKGEIGVLQTTFKEMVKSMGRRRAEAENQLLHSEKQASVGRLAAGVAHEINNPLTGILAYAEDLKEDAKPSDPRRKDYEVIVQEALRCRQIVRSLLDFARQDASSFARVHAGDLIEKALNVLTRQAAFRNIAFERRIEEGLPPIEVDPTQIQQVLVNLIVNAQQAMPEGGTIVLAAGRSEEGNQVEFLVKDQGHGISQEIRSQIFEPFFSTKDGKTEGLGLAVCFGIVQQHGGTIDFHSEPGSGTTFRVLLPFARNSDPGKESPLHG
jgi:two-component system NtrC family sensor kinase